MKERKPQIFSIDQESVAKQDETVSRREVLSLSFEKTRNGGCLFTGMFTSDRCRIKQSSF